MKERPGKNQDEAKKRSFKCFVFGGIRMIEMRGCLNRVKCRGNQKGADMCLADKKGT